MSSDASQMHEFYKGKMLKNKTLNINDMYLKGEDFFQSFGKNSEKRRTANLEPKKGIKHKCSSNMALATPYCLDVWTTTIRLQNMADMFIIYFLIETIIMLLSSGAW